MSLSNNLRIATKKYPLLCLTPIIVVFYLLLNFTFSNLEIITSPSIDHMFLWKRNASIESGNFVKFKLSHPVLVKSPVSVTKKVTCVPGDNLTTNTINKTHFCNGVYVGKAKDFSKNNIPLPFFVFNGVVPEGSIFVSGSHEDSFDSRYWGFLSLDDSTLIPLTTLF